MKILYVIDPTARQYGFPIRSGLKVRVDDKEKDVIGDKEDLDLFHSVMMNGTPFTIIENESEFVAFGQGKVVGVKITNE